MKAVLVRSLDDVTLVDMAPPFAGPGEIVVAMKAVGICGSDTTLWYAGTSRRRHPSSSATNPRGSSPKSGPA